MARRRRRNSGGVIGWMTAHPWMTFFLVGSAIALPVNLLHAQRAASPPPPPPVDPLSLPTTPATKPPVFVPGVDGPFVPGEFS